MAPKSLKTSRNSCKVRALESVWHSMITAIVGGNITSKLKLSSAAPLEDRPWPLAMVDSIVDLGNPIFLAAATSPARRALWFGSGP